MGHVDQTILLQASNLGPNPSSGKIVNTAVRNWDDDPDMDRGSENVWGGAHTTAPSSERASWLFVEARRENHRIDEAIIVPIPRDSDIVQSTKNVTVKVSGELADRLRHSHSYQERSVLLRKVEKEAGKRVVDVKVVKFPARKKAKAVATEGKTVTVYDVIGVDYQWKKEYVVAGGLPTFPAAKAKAVECASDPEHDRYNSFTVRARIQRVLEDGTVNKDMAVIARPTADEVTLTVQATFETVKAGWKADRYAVTFDIHI